MDNKELYISNDINQNMFMHSLIELTKVEFNNLCEKSSKPRNKLLYKAYKRTNSLKKIWRLSKLYELSIPHEEYASTIIPLMFKRVMTNPSVDSFRQAKDYLEAYNLVINFISSEFSATEVKSCFDSYTFDFLKENLTSDY
ncbi:hypothetical protein [Staphylococcus xylosus]|uniref:hypothetical protein n=1 Tax=Staphylococcus xylosus TaxID=1288 RepID=UPI00194F99D6|nr:hypothetical protein [Staphylococcus xylosus]MBM6639473.1 hypothetical protein [Staphylococcus xylosus]